MARGQNKPVSGPGKLSQRTDKQPTRVPTGGPYGSAQASQEQQQAAPLAVAGNPPAGAGGGQPIPAVPPPGGAFGPTERPGEPDMAGADTRGQSVAQDVDGFLRVLYSQFPHPAIGALLRKDIANGNRL